MSSVGELLAELRAAGITLSAHAGKLKVAGAAAALTPALRERITQHKPALLALLDEVAKATAATPKLALLRRDDTGPRALSYVQERIWFLERISPNTPLHNVGLALRFQGPLRPDALRAALTEIVRRHDVLRSVIVVEGEAPRQVVRAPGAVELPVEPLHEATPRAREERLAARLTTLLAEPFDLAKGPLVRFRLIALSEHDHVLVALAHHIVWDGRSSDIFRDELVALYDALTEGGTATLAEPTLRYADFADALRTASEQGAFAAPLDYWKRSFTPLPEPLDMPTDAPRTPLRSGAGATVSARFLPEVVSGLRALARDSQATLQMVLLAAIDVVLARFSGQPDVVIGSAYDQREQAELDGLIGCFVNTIALRTQISLDEPFSLLLGRVRETSLGALAHRDVPFERVVEAVAPPRDTSRTPLYQVMFSYQERPRAQRSPRGVQLTELTLPTGGAATDLFLWIGNRDSELHAVLDYASDLFRADTAQRVLSALATLLEAVMRDPSCPVGRLPLVPPEERRQLLTGLNDTARPRVLGGRVHELVEAQVARTPDATAIIFEAQSLSYAALDAQANQLAHVLRAQGVGRDQLVGVALSRTLALPVALLAVLKTGAAYVPLDPSYPPERLRGMADDAALSLIVTERAHAALFDGLAIPRFALDDATEQHAEALTTAVRAPGDERDLMYVIYTSGSTGKPKGVPIEHRNVTNFLDGMRERLTLSAGGTWVSATSVSFDISVLEIFGALSHGFTLVFIGQTYSGVTEDPRYAIAAQIERHAATHFQCTPSQAILLLADPSARRALRHVRELLVGGEALGLDVAHQLTDSIAPTGRLLNMYGPTETTIWSSTSVIPRDATRISLGRPIANTTFYVLDAAGELAPRGVVGELCIGGLSVARGYLRRDDLTRERFLPDPFASAADARLYRTGDLVRYRHDGTLEYLGRNDFQVKLRGFRIELGEIESALRGHPSVREAAVVARDQQQGDKRLVAYVVYDGTPNAAALRAYLRDAGLPDYMLPQAFVALDRMPVTGSGKLDRKALPAPAEESAVETSDYVPPEGPTERLLAEVFREVLGGRRVGAHDSFFSLGGHSLLAVRLVSKLRDALGLELPIMLVFSHPELRALARAIDALKASDGAARARPFPPRSDAREAPLSFAQKRLWFIDQLTNDSTAQHLALTLRLRGALDVTALQRALDFLIVRHETLRTRVAVERGVPRLALDEPSPAALDQRDLTGATDEALHAALTQFGATPFDLAQGPLLRVLLVRRAADEHVLCALAHHATWDGTSLGIFQRELGIAYDAFHERTEAALDARLPALDARYLDYTRWERALVEQGAYDAQLAFWKDKLQGAPTLDFPTDLPRPQLRSGRGAIERLELDRNALDALEALAKREGATLYMALVALLDVLALHFTKQRDVVVAAPVDGRVRRELEGVLGMFVNTVLLRVELAPELSFRTLLGRVRAAALEAFSHADVPFDRVVHAVDPPRDTSRTALYQLMFSYLEGTDEATKLGSLPATHVPLEGHEASTDLFLYIPNQGTQVCAHLEYATDLFEPETARRLLTTYARLIAFAVARPDARLADFPAADPLELSRLTAAINATAQPLDGPLRIDALVARQVDATPDALALVFRERTLTYRALDEQANRLAHLLIARGARRDAFIGVCMRRTDALIVALLAVVKSGAAYLPLDPAYPGERVRFMVEDSAAQLVLTERDTADLVHDAGATLLVWEDLASELPTQPSTRPTRDTSPRDLMYVIYTSGSTGKPKGVLVEHRNVANFFAGMRERITLTPGGRWLSGTSVSFDISVLEIFGSLSHGLTLVLLGAGQAGAPELPPFDIASLLVSQRITHYQCTPSQALLLLADRAACAALSHVRELLIGGEALTLDIATKLQEHLGGILINMYGPTETTVWSTSWPVPMPPTRIALGRPIANTTLYALDERLAQVPVGVPGELYIGGASVTRGYLGRDDLTAERFIPDPYARANDARLYKTGDLVRFRNDGSIEFLGRNDFQVKLRGFRIELGEIESALRALTFVRETVVIARDDSDGDARLIAYIVPSEQTPSDPAALRGALRARLPEYMLPAAFVALSAFPLTGSGKVDRSKLPAPSAPVRTREVSAAPRSALEQRLAACWQSVLKTTDVGLDDNFFDLGGHSLLMGRLADEISTALERRVSIPELFQFPSIRTLAQHLEQPSATARASSQERGSQRRAATRNVQGRKG